MTALSFIGDLPARIAGRLSRHRRFDRAEAFAALEDEIDRLDASSPQSQFRSLSRRAARGGCLPEVASVLLERLDRFGESSAAMHEVCTIIERGGYRRALVAALGESGRPWARWAQERASVRLPSPLDRSD